MKKITIGALLMSLAIASFGQQANFTQHQAVTKTKPRPDFKATLDKNQMVSYRAIEHASKTNAVGDNYWLSYAVTMDRLLGGGQPLSRLSTNYLFPDSTVLARFGDSWSGPWVHYMGDILDVKSDQFKADNGNFNWNESTLFAVDTVEIIYGYVRKSDDSVVDTLIVELITSKTGAGTPKSSMPLGGFLGDPKWLQDYGADTILYRHMRYDPGTNSLPSDGANNDRKVFKMPLTKDDTANARLRNLLVVTNGYKVEQGRLLGCAWSFKPGYSYQFGDSLVGVTSNKNVFYLASYEEKGENTFPSYTDCPLENTLRCDFNSSSVVTTDIRYDNTAQANGWDSTFIPSYAYGNTWAFEHHLVSYKVRELAVGIAEINATNGAKLSQNKPNPFTGNTTISYTIPTAMNIALEVYDITGKQVMRLDEGKKAGGNYVLEINSGKLHPGVYFYTLVAGGDRLTKRMTVIE